MPISIEKLQEAQRPLKERILSFLEKSSDQAFSLYEILAGVEGYDPLSTTVLLGTTNDNERGKLLQPYQAALASLLVDGKVEKAEYQGSTYFAIKNLFRGLGNLVGTGTR